VRVDLSLFVVHDPLELTLLARWHCLTSVSASLHGEVVRLAEFVPFPSGVSPVTRVDARRCSTFPCVLDRWPLTAFHPVFSDITFSCHSWASHARGHPRVFCYFPWEFFAADTDRGGSSPQKLDFFCGFPSDLPAVAPRNVYPPLRRPAIVMGIGLRAVFSW